MDPLLILDFDSTIIRDETLDEIARYKSSLSENSKQEIIKITSLAMAGSIEFSKALKQRINLLNINQDDIFEIASILKNRISRSFLDESHYIQSKANSIYIISGGFKEIITPLVKDYGIHEDHVFANKFRYDEKGYIKTQIYVIFLYKSVLY